MDSNCYFCRRSSMSKLGLYSAIFFYPSVAVALLFASVIIISELKFDRSYTFPQLFILLAAIIIAIFLAFFLLILSRNCYLMETRRILIDSRGFVVEKKKRRYTWKEIDSIGIVAFAADASKQIYQVQVCIFIAPVNTRMLKLLRDSYLYGAFNRDKFVLMDYDKIIMSHLRMQNFVQINDFRPYQMKL